MKIEIRDATTLDLKCDARIKQRADRTSLQSGRKKDVLNMLTRR